MIDYQDVVKQGRAVYKAWTAPSRQEDRGTKGVIGAPPTGYKAGSGDPGQTYGPKGKAGRSSSYAESLRQKQAADRAKPSTTTRPRSYGPMGQATDVPPWRPRPGGGGGGSDSTSTMLAGMPWMASPWYWLGIGGIAFLLLRKRKK